jgi:hypothetical protein
MRYRVMKAKYILYALCFVASGCSQTPESPPDQAAASPATMQQKPDQITLSVLSADIVASFKEQQDKIKHLSIQESSKLLDKVKDDICKSSTCLPKCYRPTDNSDPFWQYKNNKGEVFVIASVTASETKFFIMTLKDSSTIRCDKTKMALLQPQLRRATVATTGGNAVTYMPNRHDPETQPLLSPQYNRSDDLFHMNREEGGGGAQPSRIETPAEARQRLIENISRDLEAVAAADSGAGGGAAARHTTEAERVRFDQAQAQAKADIQSIATELRQMSPLELQRQKAAADQYIQTLRIEQLHDLMMHGNDLFPDRSVAFANLFDDGRREYPSIVENTTERAGRLAGTWDAVQAAEQQLTTSLGGACCIELTRNLLIAPNTDARAALKTYIDAALLPEQNAYFAALQTHLTARGTSEVGFPARYLRQLSDSETDRLRLVLGFTTRQEKLVIARGGNPIQASAEASSMAEELLKHFRTVAAVKKYLTKDAGR